MIQIILEGRTDVDEFFALSGIFESAKLTHTPFLVFLHNSDMLKVQVVDNVSALLQLEDTTRVMCQWRGEWRSDFFQFTVQQIRHAYEKRLAPLKEARNVVKHLGPQGGFRSLSYEYLDNRGINCHATTQFKAEAEKLETFFRQYNIPVEIRRI
jgi:hypothetical protein